ncbi:MAG: transporter substrate-binding protein [Xanthobacteraceae bacterium]|jgi:tripartite-type tricarboxylate transporter receptor subunit TctC|nr:transporter substrate-binding protein [Xanthobacteraceae bacterium]
MHRRTFLHMAAGLPIASLAGAPAFSATAWPTRPVTVVVGVAAGGQADIAARAVSVGLAKVVGQPVIVDNRTGAGGAIGAAVVVRSDPDGHTLLMALSAAVVLPEAERLAGRKPLYEMSQFTPVARVLGDPNLLTVPANSPYKTVKDLVDDAKKRPGEIAYASSGNFGGTHLSMEMFCQNADIKLLHVPYRGGAPALSGLLGDQVAVTALGAGPLKGFTDDGKLRVLATFGAERHPAFPNAPTFAESGYPDVVFNVWAGLFAPKALPDDILAKLREAMRTVMADPQTDSILTKAGSPPAYMDAPEFAAYIATDSARLLKTVQKIGKLE